MQKISLTMRTFDRLGAALTSRNIRCYLVPRIGETIDHEDHHYTVIQVIHHLSSNSVEIHVVQVG